MSSTFQTRLATHRDVFDALGSVEAQVDAAAAAMIAALRADGTIFFCGNGGSAADAQHLAAEFEGRFELEREPLAAMALTTNSSTVTAVGNDYGFEQAFLRPLQAHARAGDVLVALSTSGNSPNCLRAVEYARTSGITTVALTGAGGGRLAEVSDVAIRVPCDRTAHVQEAHIFIGHVLCEVVESTLAEV